MKLLRYALLGHPKERLYPHSLKFDGTLGNLVHGGLVGDHVHIVDYLWCFEVLELVSKASFRFVFKEDTFS